MLGIYFFLGVVPPKSSCAVTGSKEEYTVVEGDPHALPYQQENERFR